MPPPRQNTQKSGKRIDKPDRAPHRHIHSRRAAVSDIDPRIDTAAATAARTGAATFVLSLLAALPRKAVADARTSQSDTALLHRFAQLRQRGFDRVAHLLMLRNEKSMCMVIGNL